MLKKIRLSILSLVALFGAYLAYADTVTVSTYYPSPYGSYQNLDTTGETHLATGGSGVSIGKATAPGSLLDLKGPGVGEVLIGHWPTDTRYAGLGLANSLAAGAYNMLSSPADTSLYINRPTGGAVRFRENNAADQMTILAGGNVGIGTTNPTTALTVANGRIQVLGTATPTTGSGLELGGGAAPKISAYNRTGGATLPLEIEASRFEFQTGNVGIGTAGPTQKLDVSGNANVSGNVTATAFITPSDARFKTDLKPLGDVLPKLSGLHGVSYKKNALGKSLGAAEDRRELGVIGQELEEVFPELITRTGSEEYRYVDYSRLTVVLLEAMKELQASVQALESERSFLKERLRVLEDKEQL